MSNHEDDEYSAWRSAGKDDEYGAWTFEGEEDYVPEYAEEYIALGEGVCLICRTYPDGSMRVGWSIKRPGGGCRYSHPR